MDMDELNAFIRARLAEDEPGPGDRRDYTSPLTLAAAWRDHPDYRPEWAPKE